MNDVLRTFSATRTREFLVVRVIARTMLIHANLKIVTGEFSRTEEQLN